MIKAIVLIDMPESCFDCDFHIVDCSLNVCQITRHIIDRNVLNYTKNYRCPLKPLPQKKDIETLKRANGTLSSRAWYREYLGYNACIDEILGGEE